MGAAVPLRSRLTRVALAGLLPVTAAAGVALWALLQNQGEATEAKTLEVTRLAAAAIDVEVERSLAALSAVAVAPAIDRNDFGLLRELMSRVLANMSGWHAMTLTRPDGVVVLHFGLTIDESETPRDSGSLYTVVKERRPAVGYLRRGPDGDWMIPIRVPVEREGKLLYVLTALLTPEAVLRVIESQHLPAVWTVSVFDSKGFRIARSHDHVRTLGTPPAPSLAKLMASGAAQGIGRTETLEGTKVYTAFVRMPKSGWSVAVGIPTETVEAGASRALATYGGGIIFSLLLALAWAKLAAGNISGPIGALRASAIRMGRGEAAVTLPRTDIQELGDLAAALADSAAQRGVAEAARREAAAQLELARDGLQAQVADLQRLHELGNEVLALPGLRDQLQAVIDAVCGLLRMPKGLVSLCDAGRSHLLVQVAHGFGPESLAQLRRVDLGDGACGLAARDDCRIVIEDTERDPRFEPFRALARAEGFRSVHSTPIRGSAGRVLGVLSVHGAAPGVPGDRDARLTDLCAQLCSILIERSHAEALAAESDRRLRVALDSTPVPFCLLMPVRDASGVIVDFTWEYANRAAGIGIALPARAMIGRRIGESAWDIWRLPGLFEALVGVVESEQPRELELAGLFERAERCFHVVATPSDGKVAVWSADITQRKQQERALQAADRRKDEFLAVLAHELRNPLAPIQQAAMVASAPAATDAQKRWSHEVIGRQVKHMALLLDDLLDVSRITRGKLELRKSPMELRAAVEAAVETARPHVEAKEHGLTVDLPPEPIWLAGDPLRIAQVVTNLLTNAARYTPAGGHIRLAAGERGSEVWLAVEDNGIGIAPENLEAIFEMFAQGSSRADAGGGLGIGLALARGIAHLHGGTVTAASDGPSRGSRFTLVLPAGEAAGANAPRDLPALAEAMTPLRILIADDNRDAAETLASVLRLSGDDVAIAYDGASALSEYLSRQPEVLILDIGMPGLSGYGVAGRIRARQDGARPLLIALTGWGQAKDKASAAGAGFDHHLTKPVDMRALFAILCSRRAPSAAVKSAVRH